VVADKVQGMVVEFLPEMFSFHCQKWLALLLGTTGLKKNRASFHPIKSKIKTNRDLLAHVFVHLTPAEVFPTVSCSFSLLFFSSSQ